MQEKQILLEFYNDFKALHYSQSELTIYDLYHWTRTWCFEKGLLPQLHENFCELASAYADQELIESYLPEEIRKTRINEKH